MSFTGVLAHTVASYRRNWKMLSFFSLPFALLFPLSLLLPNFISLSGIFLRYGSIRSDLSSVEAAFIVLVFLVSLLLFSFALVGINLVIKSQRTLLKLTHYEQEKIEAHTLQLFTVFLLLFVASFLANLFLYDYGLTGSVGQVLSLAFSLAVLFVPQALVMEELGVLNSVKRSLSLCFYRFPSLVLYLLVASLLVILVSFVFLQFPDVRVARYLSVLVNALLILPFLEVLKAQLYLSKYSLLR